MELTTVNITLVELAIFGASGMAVGAILVDHFFKLKEKKYIKMVIERDNDNAHLQKMIDYYKPLIADAVKNKMYKDALQQAIKSWEGYKPLPFGDDKIRAYISLEALKDVERHIKENLISMPLETKEASNE